MIFLRISPNIRARIISQIHQKLFQILYALFRVYYHLSMNASKNTKTSSEEFLDPWRSFWKYFWNIDKSNVIRNSSMNFRSTFYLLAGGIERDRACITSSCGNVRITKYLTSVNQSKTIITDSWASLVWACSHPPVRENITKGITKRSWQLLASNQSRYDFVWFLQPNQVHIIKSTVNYQLVVNPWTPEISKGKQHCLPKVQLT